MRIPLSEIRQRPLDEPSAWSCFVANMTVLPGLGSVIAGRRVGYLQASLALIGFALTAWWGIWFVASWIQTREIPVHLDRHLVIGVIGAFIFLIAWVWAFFSGLGILREVRRKKTG